MPSRNLSGHFRQQADHAIEIALNQRKNRAPFERRRRSRQLAQDQARAMRPLIQKGVVPFHQPTQAYCQIRSFSSSASSDLPKRIASLREHTLVQVLLGREMMEHVRFAHRRRAPPVDRHSIEAAFRKQDFGFDQNPRQCRFLGILVRRCQEGPGPQVDY